MTAEHAMNNVKFCDKLEFGAVICRLLREHLEEVSMSMKILPSTTSCHIDNETFMII